MSFNAIDISSHNAGIKIAAMTTTQAVIIKATQGLTYVNPYYKKHYDDTKKSGKLVGVYHYFGGNDPIKEAEFFGITLKSMQVKLSLYLIGKGIRTESLQQVLQLSKHLLNVSISFPAFIRLCT